MNLGTPNPTPLALRYPAPSSTFGERFQPSVNSAGSLTQLPQSPSDLPSSESPSAVSVANTTTSPEVSIGLDAFREALIESELLGVAPPAVEVSPLQKQEGGDHYKKLKIQPLEYIHANGIPFAEGCVIKYVSRWRDKGGIADLKKAKHFVELLIELETRK